MFLLLIATLDTKPSPSRREVTRIHPARIPTPKDRRYQNGRTKLLTKIRPRPARSGPTIPILPKQHIPRPLVARVPDMPPGPVDHIAQTRVLEDDACERAPGAAEVVGAGGDGVVGGGGDGGAVDDVVGGVGGGGAAVGGDVAEGGGEDADVDLVEPGGGVLAEDEVAGGGGS